MSITCVPVMQALLFLLVSVVLNVVGLRINSGASLRCLHDPQSPMCSNMNLSGSGRPRIVKREMSITMQQPSYRFTLPSCKPGTLVGRVTAKDSQSTPVYYFIDAPNRNIATNSNTGQLFLINFISSGVDYNVNIRATGNSGSSSAKVTYTCSAPAGEASGSPTRITAISFGPNFTFTLNSCTIGTVVGTVTASGGDSTCTYTSQNSSPYSVVPSSGKILVTGIPSGTQTFMVQADCGSGTTTAPVMVTSSCTLSPTFSQPSYQFTVSSCSPGTVVGSISATNAIVYVIEGGDAFFTIMPSSGLLRTTNTLTNAMANFQVRAYGSSAGSSSVVSVLVRSPTCVASPLRFLKPSYSYSPKNCSSNGFAGIVSVSGGSGSVTYSIDNPTGVYRIIPSTGAIFSVGPLTAGTLTVRATSGASSLTVPVTISTEFCPSSDVILPGAPIFSQTVYSFTAGICTPDALVDQVTATGTSGSAITYLIISGPPAFKIDASTGILSTSTSDVSKLTGTTEALVVEAKDATGRKSTASVNITVVCDGQNSASNVVVLPPNDVDLG